MWQVGDKGGSHRVFYHVLALPIFRVLASVEFLMVRHCGGGGWFLRFCGLWEECAGCALPCRVAAKAFLGSSGF